MKKYKIFDDIVLSKSVCLIGHLEPDADALCSMVVLRDFLMRYFNIKVVDMFADCDKLPENYYPILENLKLNKPLKKYEVAIMMDTPNLDRLGKFKELFKNAKKRIVIDHHKTNTKPGDINLVEEVSSTCEIVYNILMSYKYIISKSNLGRIYAGIITDTNNFVVGNFDSKTLDIASKCMKFIDYKKIYKNFLGNNTLRNMNLLSLAIQNIITLEDGKIIITHITHDQARRQRAHFNDYMGIINKLSTISGSKLILFVYPREDEYYVSMRADVGYDVATIAKKYGGGGHAGAAAFISNKDLKEIEKEVLIEFFDQIKKPSKISTKIF